METVSIKVGANDFLDCFFAALVVKGVSSPKRDDLERYMKGSFPEFRNLAGENGIDFTCRMKNQAILKGSLFEAAQRRRIIFRSGRIELQIDLERANSILEGNPGRGLFLNFADGFLQGTPSDEMVV